MALNLEEGSSLTAVLAVATAGAALTGLSGAATTYSSSLFGYALAGIAYAKALVSGGTTPVVDIVTGAAFKPLLASQACSFVWVVNAAGTVGVAQGPIVPWTDTTAGSTACPLPLIPANTFAPFASHTVQNGAAGTSFTLGTSNWNQTGISGIVVTNLCQLKNVPQLTV